MKALKINQRPVYNKYCIMTTLEMLKACKASYTKTLKRIESHRDHLVDKFYESLEVPDEVREEITDLNNKINKYNKHLENIDTAINVLSDTCNQEKDNDNEDTNIT